MPPEPQIPIEQMYAAEQEADFERRWRAHLGQSPSPLENATHSGALSSYASSYSDNPARDLINTTLHTLTGGVLSLDAIGEHLTQVEQGTSWDETPLGKKLTSLEALKLVNIPGNLAHAAARSAALGLGATPETADLVGGSADLLASLFSPGAPLKILSKAGSVSKVFYSGLFSNPASHTANLTANALASVWAVPVRFGAAVASAVESTITGAPRAVYFGEPAALAYGMVTAIPDGIIKGVEAFRTGVAPFGTSKLDNAADVMKMWGALPRYR